VILTDGVRRQILAQIRRDKHRPVVLPDFCYWKGRDQPVVYVDNLPENLNRVLYRELIGPLDYSQSLRLREGIPKRNVNPYLFEVTQHRRRGSVCPNGHSYEGNEMASNSAGWRCRTCYENWHAAHRKGGESVAVVNRGKDSCPQGHPYSGENLIILKNGRRRCRTCHKANMARYRAEKGKSNDNPRHRHPASG
jgi:hypothetical protein